MGIERLDDAQRAAAGTTNERARALFSRFCARIASGRWRVQALPYPVEVAAPQMAGEQPIVTDAMEATG